MKKVSIFISIVMLWGVMVISLPYFSHDIQAQQVQPTLAAPACSGYYGKLIATNWPGGTATVTCQGAGRQRGKCVGNSTKLVPGQSYGFGNCNCLDHSMPCFAVSGLPPTCKTSNTPMCAANTQIAHDDVIVTCSGGTSPKPIPSAPNISICPVTAASAAAAMVPAVPALPVQQTATNGAIQFNQQNPKSTLQLNYFTVPISKPKPFIPLFASVPATASPSGACVALANANCVSSNWTGYTEQIPATAQKAYVSGDWTVAATDCSGVSGKINELSQWVGMDGGYTPGNGNGWLAQLGSYNDCVNGQPSDWSWTLALGNGTPWVALDLKTYPTNPGDQMTANITMTSPGQFLTNVQNKTQGWAYQTTMSYPAANIVFSNREVILENETIQGLNNPGSKMPKFPSVPFYNNLFGLDNQTPQPLAWGSPGVACLNGADQSGVIHSEPSTLNSAGDFLVTWLQ